MKTPAEITRPLWGASLLAAALLLAETPPAASEGLNLSATTANVLGAPDSVRFEILRWSTEEERDRLMSAWELKLDSAAKAGKGKGAAKLGKGAAKAKGPNSAGGLENAATPEVSLARALQETATVGYLWSSEIAGYALRYAGRVAQPDGSQRILLITQRRLGTSNQLWDPTFEGPPNRDDFSVIELRLSAMGEGEGKASLVGKAAADATAKTFALENYDALPAVFLNVHKQAAKPGTEKP